MKIFKDNNNLEILAEIFISIMRQMCEEII